MIKVSAWLGGQLLLAGVIGTTSAIGLWALGVPFFYVLALLSAVGEMIPVVGPILSADSGDRRRRRRCRRRRCCS